MKKNYCLDKIGKLKFLMPSRTQMQLLSFYPLLCLKETGFVQKEIKLALDVAQEKPEGAIYCVPARLDECVVPDSLRDYQWVNLFELGGYEKIKLALRTRNIHNIHQEIRGDNVSTPLTSTNPVQLPSNRFSWWLRKEWTIVSNILLVAMIIGFVVGIGLWTWEEEARFIAQSQNPSVEIVPDVFAVDSRINK